MPLSTMLWFSLGAVALATTAALADRARRWWIGRDRSTPVSYATWVCRDARLAASLSSALGELIGCFAAMRRDVPEIDAVFVSETWITVRFATDVTARPAGPWRPSAGGHRRSWAVPTGDLRRRHPDRLPFPTLVPLGSSGDVLTLLDLGRARGVVGVGGDARQARRLLNGLLFELVSNPWCRQVTGTLAGFGERIEAPDPTRVRYTPSVEDALADAERFAREAAGNGGHRETRVVVLAHPPADHLVGQLVRLAEDPHCPVLVLCLGHPRFARLRLTASPDGEVFVEPHRMRLHGLADDVERHQRRLRAARGTEVAGTTRPPGERSVEIRVLGPLEVRAPGPVHDGMRTVLTELLAVAALHPKGLTPAALNRQAGSAEAAETALRELQRWLGTSDDGQPRLVWGDGGWVLTRDVRVDWHRFRELATTGERRDESARLVSALSLIRGEFLAAAGRSGSPLRDVVATAGEVHALAVHTVRRAAELATAEGDYRKAEWALRKGVALLPRVEGLWRALLLFHGEHNRAAVGRTVNEMMAVLVGDDGYPRLQQTISRLVAALQRDVLV
ncbi:AfsR/SARP family transcriptional regulator [Qaidamihabitans albus]|uniref:AfsR/SARP family transcriptional regulator n=1 Tax=Qaidamihabitans albus TaxID=2795733 RepID=UPI0018F18AC9|nr:bacterial transcriptional activator domain-containing protein [Qaidamihabitans albus]